jgi:hypothetical protein
MNKINIEIQNIDKVIGVHLKDYTVKNDIVVSSSVAPNSFHEILTAEYFNVYDSLIQYPKYPKVINHIYQIILEQLMKQLQGISVIFYDVYINPNILNVLTVLSNSYYLLFGDFLKYTHYILRDKSNVKLLSVNINTKLNTQGSCRIVPKLNNKLIEILDEMIHKVDNLVILSTFQELFSGPITQSPTFIPNRPDLVQKTKHISPFYCLEFGINKVNKILEHLDSNGGIYILAHIFTPTQESKTMKGIESLDLVSKDVFYIQKDLRASNINCQDACISGNVLILNGISYDVSNFQYKSFLSLVYFVKTNKNKFIKSTTIITHKSKGGIVISDDSSQKSTPYVYKRQRLLTITQSKNLSFVLGITHEIGVLNHESPVNQVDISCEKQRALVEVKNGFENGWGRQTSEDVFVLIFKSSLVCSGEDFAGWIENPDSGEASGCDFEFKTPDFTLILYLHGLIIPNIFEIIQYILNNKHTPLFHLEDPTLTKMYLTPTYRMNVDLFKMVFEAKFMNIEFNKYVDIEDEYDDLKCVMINAP